MAGFFKAHLPKAI